MLLSVARALVQRAEFEICLPQNPTLTSEKVSGTFLPLLYCCRVHEEHGASAAVGAFAVEGAAVLADALAVPGLPTAYWDGCVPAARSTCEVKAEPAWLEGKLVAPAVAAGRAGPSPDGRQWSRCGCDSGSTSVRSRERHS
jgi:hypothetical protein